MLQAGWPSFVLVRRIQRMGYFRESEEISVGDAAIFKATAAYHGFNIKNREVTIECREVDTVIEDKSLCEFRSGSTLDVTHSVKVPAQSEIEVLGWHYEYPPNLNGSGANEVGPSAMLAP
jgi:hypothetical protein